jgi:nucleoside-specific outer membrane channel protein Tsx
LNSYDRIGWCVSRDDDVNIKMKSFVDLYDAWGKEIELYGFIQHVVTKNLERDRKNILEKWEESIKWMNKNFKRKYKNIVKFKGFHAQLRTKNLIDGGRPTERGIVDEKGQIIIDLDPLIDISKF